MSDWLQLLTLVIAMRSVADTSEPSRASSACSSSWPTITAAGGSADTARTCRQQCLSVALLELPTDVTTQAMHSLQSTALRLTCAILRVGLSDHDAADAAAAAACAPR